MNNIANGKTANVHNDQKFSYMRKTKYELRIIKQKTEKNKNRKSKEQIQL